MKSKLSKEESSWAELLLPNLDVLRTIMAKESLTKSEALEALSIGTLLFGFYLGNYCDVFVPEKKKVAMVLTMTHQLEENIISLLGFDYDVALKEFIAKYAPKKP